MNHWWEKYTEDKLIGKAVRYEQETSIVVGYRHEEPRVGWPIKQWRIVRVWPPFEHGVWGAVKALEEV